MRAACLAVVLLVGCGDGPDAVVAVDAGAVPCNDTQCDPHAVCLPAADGGVMCACPAGFFGDGVTCRDVDECQTTDRCPDRASCTNLIGSFSCVCDPGFMKVAGRCLDVDECAPPPVGVITRLNDCGDHTDCLNTVGGFRCTCQLPFIGDGKICQAPYVQLAAGDGHTCGVRADGTLWCWGDNQLGQLGVTGSQHDRPVQVGSASNVATGSEHSCADMGGKLSCWGANAHGSLGDGSGAPHAMPVGVTGAPGWAALSAAGASTCAIKSPGTLWCWGDNQFGQLGDDSPTDRLDPVEVGTAADWDTVAVGFEHSCGLRAGALYCWGDNASGELGVPVLTGSDVPVAVGGTDWLSVSVGFRFTCGIRRGLGGSLWCWGSNGLGQLALGDNDDRSVPVLVRAAGANYQSVSSGRAHACALKVDGTLWCWGDNRRGQLGLGHKLEQLAPTQVGGDNAWQSVAAGSEHTCGIRGRAALCWGAGDLGQLGGGDTNDVLTPEPVRD